MSGQIGGLGLQQSLASLRPPAQLPLAIHDDEYQQRLEHARALLREQGHQALLVSAGSSLRYFSGVPWRASERLVAMLLTLKGEPVLFCPEFEAGSLQRAQRIPADVRYWHEHANPCELVAQALAERGVRSLALDPMAPFGLSTRLREAAPTVQLVDARAIIDGCRMCKSAAELALMKHATAITLEVHRGAARAICEGVGTAELRQFIDTAHRQLGADGGSTFCIVQFGQATAFPHGIPGEQTLREGDLVLIDTGCTVHGYNSDITRCYIFGKPDADQQRIWDLEQAAQLAAFAAVRPGVPCEDVDLAARSVIERAGLGPGYNLPGLPHRTGHGCGLDIHEAPYVVRGDRTPLQPGMCCSDEPMIVVPDRFGVRLEDHFYVTENGAAWFTPPSPAIDRPFADPTSP